MKTFITNLIRPILLVTLFLISSNIYSSGGTTYCVTISTVPPTSGVTLCITNFAGTTCLVTDPRGKVYYCSEYGDSVHIVAPDLDCAYPPCPSYFVPKNTTTAIADGDCYCEWGMDKTQQEGLINNDKFKLEQNYPNPFNPKTSISFELFSESNAKLTIYDTKGEEVAVLVDSRLNTGIHNYEFDGSNVGSGIYFYKLETPDYTSIRKMILVK